MEFKLNTVTKTITLLSDISINDFNKTINTLIESKVITSEWIINNSDTNWTYPIPLYSGGTAILPYVNTCTGECGTGCTCKTQTTFTTNNEN